MIQQATQQDIPQLSKLLQYICDLHSKIRPDLFAAGKSKYNEQQLLELLQDSSRPIFVYRNEEGLAVGYIFCAVKLWQGEGFVSQKSLYIDDLCVDQQYQHQGIGKALFNHARNYAKEIQCHNITLNVWQGNDSAIKFYQNLGLSVQRTFLEEIL